VDRARGPRIGDTAGAVRPRADDPISPLPLARARYAAAPRAGLVTIAGGRHDTLNDITHRTVAATIVMFLERLRLGSDLPTIAVSESLGR
jgi:hypothetical protein